MNRIKVIQILKLALLCGGANLLFSSCAQKQSATERNLETLITQQSDTLTLINSQNGKKMYYLYTPLMERYQLAQDPYMEFRYGLEIINYDTLGVEASKLVCDYAIFYENRELWEARGNVVASSNDGKKLFTQQLFWDQKTDKIYSNVDSRVVDGDDEFIGDGFESDSGFNQWEFRNPVGRVMVDMEQREEPVDGEQRPVRVETKPRGESMFNDADKLEKEREDRKEADRKQDRRKRFDEKRKQKQKERIDFPQLER